MLMRIFHHHHNYSNGSTHSITSSAVVLDPLATRSPNEYTNLPIDTRYFIYSYIKLTYR